jgi:diguanylate cyclase (GGDEF)-like protein
MVDGFELLASVLCLSRALVRRPGRIAALVLGLALLSWSLGDVVLRVESLGGATPPTPSLADIFYLGFYPWAYIGIVLFMRGDTRRLTTPSWLDGIIAGLGAAAVVAAFAFHGLLQLTGQSKLEVLTNLAYPVGDTLLLFLVVGGTVVLSGRRKTPWLLLATGIAINIAGDTANLFGSSIGASRGGAIANTVAWPISILLISMAVWVRPGRSDPSAPQRPPGFLLPGLAAVAALAILVVGPLSETSRIAIGLATATLMVVGVRLVLSARSLRTLTQKRYRQSVTDDLTGLANRRHLFNILDAFFADEADAPERELAFLFVDLNRFKELNDAFGHSAGDEVLKQLAARLKASVGSSDTLIRLGGDEFAVVLMDAGADHATEVAKRLTASLDEPFTLEAVCPRLSASIGISLAPTDANDSAGLVSCGDVAMYRAKERRSPFVLYEHEEDFDGGGNRLRMADELRASIEQGELVLHYQPLLDLGNDEITTYEALLRWPHPRLGLIPPLKFLPLAEEAGLMPALTAWVLEQALAQCAAWRVAGRPVSVAVNISATNLLDTGFIGLIQDLLKRHDLPTNALILELTETSIITDFERSKLVIEQLQDLGIVVSIDDFGAGFTSLAYLSSLAVGELKLDRTFLAPPAAEEAENSAQLVRATIELGHTLGLRVVAEGVEDAATLSMLSDLGCDLVQGYFIARPGPPDELTSPPNAKASAPVAQPSRRVDRPIRAGVPRNGAAIKT